MNNNNIKANILFIMADQLSASALPCYGNKTVIAPNLSKMAEEGIVFENNYCNYPLCAPSRASMMTGRLTSRIGSFDNGAELPASIPTFAHHLRAEGYYTCISGKMHFLGPDQYHGFEDRLTTEIYPADLSWTPNWDPEAKKYSFETGAGMSDIGTMLDSGKCQWSMQMEYDEEVFANARAKLYDFAKEGSDQPFLFVVSFTQPHDPFLMENLDFAYAPPFSTAIHPFAHALNILLNKMSGAFETFTPVEFAEGKAEGYRMVDASLQPSIHSAPYLDLTKIDGEVEGFGKDEKLLIVCAKGKRAYMVQNRLKYYGYTNTKVLEGGTTFNTVEEED